MNMELEKKSHPPWTDEFLDQKRQIGDVLYDKHIRNLLGQAYLEDFQEVFANWANLQSDQVTEGKRILSSWTDDAHHSPESIRAVDSLADLQIKQYQLTDEHGTHLWPQKMHFHIQSIRGATLRACRALSHYDLRTAFPAMESALASGRLLVEEYEKLSKRVASNPDLMQKMSRENRAAYNLFLGVVDAIHRNPAIFLWDEAFRTVQFKTYPLGLQNNFTPVVCPDWLDGKKLDRGVKIWKRHMAESLLVLYSHSLPACYLDHKGIPMLYETERLAKQEFIAERIYETGFFLNDVMEEDGLAVIEEPVAKRIAYLAIAAHKTYPDWHFQLGRYLQPEWRDAAGGVHSYSEALADPEIKKEFDVLEKQDATPESYSAADFGAPSFERLFGYELEGYRNLSGNFLQSGCLWGPGFLAAHKVRYFHAEMRFRALQADPPYEREKYGYPINQEDLAYTLLTFGYVIPVGLEKLGAVITRAEKEGFLHCWRLVGHLIGVDDDLLTDDWDQAKVLYETIKKRVQGKSANVIQLTNALCTFITDLLPKWLPFRSAVPAVWIRDQLGADADDLFDPATQAASRNIPVRVCWGFVKHVFLRLYFLSLYMIWDRLAFSRKPTDFQLQILGEALLTSWHQTFRRQRFDLTASVKGFAQDAGESAGEKEKRHEIRRKVFLWVLIGFGLMVIWHPIFYVGFACFVAMHYSSADWVETLMKVMAWLLVFDQLFLTYILRKLKRFLKQLAIESGSQL